MPEEKDQQQVSGNVGAAPGAGDPSGDGGKETSAESSYTIKVGGETRTVTLKEALDLASKAAGADQKFQEAAKIRKEGEEGIRYRDLVKNMKDPNYSPSEAELRELAGMIGVDPEDFMEYVGGGQVEEDGEETRTGGQEPQLSEQFKEVFREQFGMDPAEAKEILGMSHRSHLDEARRQIRAESDKMVDKDEIFGKMMIGERGKERAQAIKEMVAEDVFGRIRSGEPYGAELLAASIQKVRAQLKDFGIPGRPDQYPVTMGLGPSVGLPAEVQSETPIKRISTAQDQDGENFVHRAMQKALKAIRNAGA